MTQPAGLVILAVSPVAEAGGAETLLLDVLVGLRRKGVGVALVALGNGPLPGVADSRGVTVHSGPALSFRSPRSIVRGVVAVRRAVASVRPDVVLASHPKGQIISRLAMLGDGSVAHVTQLYDPPGRSVSTRIAARLSGPRFSITDETAAAYRKLNSRLDPIVIRPGTDSERLREDARRGDGDRAWLEAGLDGPGPRVVMIGRLQRFKGPFDFLGVAEVVLRSMPDARFLIVGPDSPMEPMLRGELERAIDDRGLGEAVALTGRLSAPDLAATVAGATLLVHPAHREPFGLAVVEALTLATPVVAYSTTGPAAILESGGGALVPAGDVEGLAAAVLHALSDPDVLARWEAETGPTADRFDLEANVVRYLDVFQRMSPSQKAPRPGPGQVTTIGVAPATASGVRDYGVLLTAELERNGLRTAEHWFDNPGDRLVPALRTSAQLIALALRVRAKESVIWHYSPVPYGFRGLPGPGVLIGVMLRIRGCKVVSMLHELSYTYRPGLDPPQARVKAGVQGLALRAVLAGSTEVVVTTEHRAAALRARSRGRDGKVHVIPVFPTIAVEHSPSVTTAAPDSRFIVGVPGYAGDGVRADLLIGALPLLGQPLDVRVVLLGAPGADSHDGRRWLSLAAEHGVEESLEFTGIVDASELSRRLSESTVVVLVNEEGPSSRKTTLAAALAHGMPVVSLDGYNRWDDLVASGAVWVVPSDAAALASSLIRLRDAPPERAALGAKGARFAAAHMSLFGAGGAFFELVTGAPPPMPDDALCAGQATPVVDDACSAGSSRLAAPGRSSQPSRSHGSGATA